MFRTEDEWHDESFWDSSRWRMGVEGENMSQSRPHGGSYQALVLHAITELTDSHDSIACSFVVVFTNV